MAFITGRFPGFGSRVLESLVWLGLVVTLSQFSSAQSPAGAKIDVSTVSETAVQGEDYTKVRQRFRTKLLATGPAPYQTCRPSKPPEGVSEIDFPSEKLRLKAWVGNLPGKKGTKQPAVLFLHGGFCFDSSDWEATQAFRDTGFIVMMPLLRGEGGQPGNFTMFYNEVDDVVNAAEYLRGQPYVGGPKICMWRGTAPAVPWQCFPR